LLPVLYVENPSKQKTQKNIVLIAVQPGDKRRLKMEFTCIECENKYTPDKTGDAEERTCFECLNKEEKTEEKTDEKPYQLFSNSTRWFGSRRKGG